MSDCIDELARADDQYRQAATAVEEIGEADLHQLADALEDYHALLDRYVETATGSGREAFENYVEFQGEIARFVETLPADLLERDRFEDAAEYLDQRRLSKSDFAHARELVEPAGDLAARLDERERALDQYRDARHTVESRHRDLQEALDELEEILAFDAVDFDAPISSLRDPIEAYNESVIDAFETYLADTSARAVLDFIQQTEAYPLVEFRSPPDDLKDFIETHPPGTEPIPTLLEWAEFTRSKLQHYVDDPGRFKAHVAANRTYLNRLDAQPLTIDWPPPPAKDLHWRTRELVSVVGRFGPAETMQSLHAIREITRADEYDRLQTAARAHAALSQRDRERLENGTIHEEYDELQVERDRIATALSEYPHR